MCLFYYQDELRRYSEASNDHDLKSHMQLCLQYMEKTFHREIDIWKGCIANRAHSQELEHRDLWMLFKPGCLVYQNFDATEELFRLRGIDSAEDEDGKIICWLLLGERMTWNRNEIGFEICRTEIHHYKGRRPVCDLNAVPLRFHPEEQRIRQDLLVRGRKFLALCGIHHCFYDGKAHVQEEDHLWSTDIVTRSELLTDTNPMLVKGRIMLDGQGYGLNIESGFIHGKKSYKSGTKALEEATEEDIMTSCCRLPGFILHQKRWGLFLVAAIENVKYNAQAYRSLILPESQKKLISALLERQEGNLDDDFDDLIEGKGKGIVFLLHGPAGVGKTFTAGSY